MLFGGKRKIDQRIGSAKPIAIMIDDSILLQSRRIIMPASSTTKEQRLQLISECRNSGMSDIRWCTILHH